MTTATDPQAIALELAAIATVRQKLADRERELKADYLRVNGARGRTAPTVDGEEVGLVYATRGSVRASVTDPSVLLRWVKERYPTEVEESVRPAFAKILSGQAKTGGVVDRETGEVTPIPGIAVEVGDPTVTVTVNGRLLPALAARHLLQIVGRQPEAVPDAP